MRLRRGYTRREFLKKSGKAGIVAAIAGRLSARSLLPPVGAAPVFTEAQRRTLDAALARMIPAEGPGDWSAADVGAANYIEKLLAGDIYAGGPFRSSFPFFQGLSRVKEMGWGRELARLREIYALGLADLDLRAGGDFASLLPGAQDAILTSLDLEGSPFFAALYAHTMEGAYSHPVYGGNKDFRAWKEFCYQGDVHGVRFANKGDPGESWNVFGGYAPEEMIEPGKCPGQGPVQ